jgi:hypothetical protein
MSLRGLAAGIAIGVLASSIGVSAQQAQQQTTAPLGDVARQAEAAKATVKKAKKRYSNADLSVEPKSETAAASPVPPSNGSMSASPGRVVTPEQTVAGGAEKQAAGKADAEAKPKQGEAHWRGRAEAIRTQMATLQERLDALAQPNAARDANPVAKTRSDAEVAKVQTGLDALKKQWARLEDAAKAEEANSAWLDPRPKM